MFFLRSFFSVHFSVSFEGNWVSRNRMQHLIRIRDGGLKGSMMWAVKTVSRSNTTESCNQSAKIMAGSCHFNIYVFYQSNSYYFTFHCTGWSVTGSWFHDFSICIYYSYLPYETASIKSPICTEQPGAFLFTAINEWSLGVLGLTSKIKTTSWKLKAIKSIEL